MGCDNCGDEIKIWQTGHKIGSMSICPNCHKNHFNEIREKQGLTPYKSTNHNQIKGFSMKNKTSIFAIIGVVLGIPLSYYFQPDIIQSKLTLSQYLSHLPDIMAEDSGDFVTPIILSVLLCAFVLGIIGYLIDQADSKKGEGELPKKDNLPESEA